MDYRPYALAALCSMPTRPGLAARGTSAAKAIMKGERLPLIGGNAVPDLLPGENPEVLARSIAECAHLIRPAYDPLADFELAVKGRGGVDR